MAKRDATLGYAHGYEDGSSKKPVRGSSPEYEDGYCAGHPALLDHLSVLTVENERMRAALERSDKFIGNYLSPWGSWKTAWWEGEVSDEMPFADDNALRRVGEIISAALSSLPAMKGEG